MELTELEQRMLLFQGMPAREVARMTGVTPDRVLEIWHELKDRGVMPRPPTGTTPHSYQAQPCTEQLSFDRLDQLEHGRRPPLEPSNPELGWTTDTEGSW